MNEKQVELVMVWAGMIIRCYDPRKHNFGNYGGRGITVCQRWRDSFYAFCEDMGVRPKGYSIDRIDNDGNYEPGNCRWATDATQCRNRRSNVMITIDGVTKNAIDWEQEPGAAGRSVISRRIKQGFNHKEAVFGKRYETYTHDGMTMTLSAWERHLGLCTYTLFKRMQRGMSFKEAIAASKIAQGSVPRKDNVNLTIDGETKSRAAWSRESGVGAGTIRDRMVKLGWDAKEAVFTPVRPKFDTKHRNS